jgi:hypothetical protein
MEPTARRIVSGLTSPFGADKVGVAMKWILVVLIGGVTPVQTDVQFDKLSDCLIAEEQLRNTYADAYEAWDKSAAVNIERRRDYRKAREFQERKLANTGTCIPHAGTDQPVAVTVRAHAENFRSSHPDLNQWHAKQNHYLLARGQ